MECALRDEIRNFCRFYGVLTQEIFEYELNDEVNITTTRGNYVKKSKENGASRSPPNTHPISTKNLISFNL